MANRQLHFLHPVTLFTTWFGAGLAPVAPGTIGSLAALPFAWLILFYGGILWLFAATLIVFLIGVIATEIYCRRTGRKDPKEAVIDEVAGQWLTLIIASPDQLWHFGVGFIFFRFFDIFKPWPVSWCDRSVPGGLGVMLDDIAAAVYALFCTFGTIWLISGKNIGDIFGNS
jgi:phosphatidylglycerophosphatase A